MSVAEAKLSSMNTREILGPAGNRVQNTEEQIKNSQNQKQKKQVMNKEMKPNKDQKHVPVQNHKVQTRNIALKSNDGSCDSSNSDGLCSSVKGVVKDEILGSSERKLVKKRVNRGSKIVGNGIPGIGLSPRPIKRCHWITSNSEPLYVQFHDKEWGVPIRDDKKLLELLILSQALTELSWPTILYNRETFRVIFEDFDPSSIAKYDEKKLLALVQDRNMLSEPKLRAVVDNARQFLKIQQEFGSFSNYCWRFVNNKQIKSGYRYARQVPAKTSKSELISKDLMRRGFRYVGPTIMYSFMQVAGLVNDHLSSCFRFSECENYAKMDPNLSLVKTAVHGEATTNT